MSMVRPLAIDRAELRENLRVAQGRRYPLILGVIALAQLLLALWYGDTAQAWVFAVLILLGAGAAAIQESDYASRTYRPLMLLNFGCAVALQIVLPADPGGILLLLAYGMSVYGASRTSTDAHLLFVGVLVVRVALWGAGVQLGWPSNVPMMYSLLSTLTISGAVMCLNIRSTRRQYEASMVSLANSEASLQREQEVVAFQNEKLTTSARILKIEAERLTAQLQAEQVLRDDLALKQVDEHQLVHAIHHDLREPLRSIVSFGQLLRRRLQSTAEYVVVEEYLEFVIDGGHRMTHMLKDLLVYASSDLDQEREHVDLNELVHEIAIDVTDLIDRSGARLQFNPLPSIEGYPTPLRQLLLNLINNALKFSRPGVPPLVTVSAEMTSEHLCLSVRDNGIGIPANQIAHVFGLFNRAHTEGEYSGSGVGLALCRRIAIAHGGQLEVQSTPGEGSVFTCKFPAHLVVQVGQDVRMNEVPTHSKLLA